MVQELGVPTLIVELLALLKYSNEPSAENLGSVKLCLDRLRNELNTYSKTKRVKVKRPSSRHSSQDKKSSSSMRTS
jgi:hypothetical protein